MRIYLYVLAGLLSALIGWNLGQFFLTDLGIFKDFPEITLFPCIAISLACGMVMNEIFISNPTRPKRSFLVARIPLLIALSLGTLVGLIAGGISQILLIPGIHLPTLIVRIVGWLLIGLSVGLAEGLTWRSHSIEAGDPKRFWYRLKISLIGASSASLIAATIFEIIRSNSGKIPDGFKALEDPLGFSILGILLGLVFSITNSPSYLAALRAGAGFEYTGDKYEIIDSQLISVNKVFPYIDKSLLKFVTYTESDEIEEGLSVQLPGKGTIKIGSTVNKSHIYIPELPPHVADLLVNRRETILSPSSVYFKTIEVNGQRLTSTKKIRLKHNYILTFHTIPQDGKNQDEKNQKKIYRFVYYNRFLDPHA